MRQKIDRGGIKTDVTSISATCRRSRDVWSKRCKQKRPVRNIHKQGLAFGATCLWMFLTGRFCLQRLVQTSRERRHVAEMLVTSVLTPSLSIFWRIRGAIKFRVFFL